MQQRQRRLSYNEFEPGEYGILQAVVYQAYDEALHGDAESLYWLILDPDPWPKEALEIVGVDRFRLAEHLFERG